MDGRKPSISPIARFGHIDADAAPTDSVGEGSSVTYSGNAQRISEGFAIALRVMGFGTLRSDVAQSEATPNPEDD